jgi:hypothetical protein
MYGCMDVAWAGMRDLLVELSRDRGEDQGGGPIRAVAEELTRVIRRYEDDSKALVDDFVNRYIDSGESLGQDRIRRAVGMGRDIDWPAVHPSYTGLRSYLADVLRRTDYCIDSAVYEKDSAGADIFVNKFLEDLFQRDEVRTVILQSRASGGQSYRRLAMAGLQVLRACRDTMTDTALVAFVERLAAGLSGAWRSLLREKPFTDWGAMKLRHEVHTHRVWASCLISIMSHCGVHVIFDLCRCASCSRGWSR